MKEENEKKTKKPLEEEDKEIVKRLDDGFSTIFIKPDYWIMFWGMPLVLNNADYKRFREQGIIRPKDGSLNREMEFTEKYRKFN